MFSLIRLATLADPEARDALAGGLRALAARHAAARLLVEPTLEGSFNGGDLMVHAGFASAAERAAFGAAADAALRATLVDGAAYSAVAEGAREPGLRGGVYRALLLAVAPVTAAGEIERFEGELLAMPRHIPAIRNWRLSRVEHAAGARAWTHVWEQEFADAGGLLGPYMLHPYHWGHVDRWFDPECPEHIVDARLCHAFARAERSVLTAA